MNELREEPQLSKGQRTRMRVLDVAEAMFAERGYEATTLRDIAGEVPIQQPGLYNYFETKDDLYAAVIERVFEDMLAAFVEFSSEVDATARAAELPMYTIHYLAEHPLSSKLLYRELLKDHRDVHPVMKRWLRQLLSAATLPLDAMDLDADRRLNVIIAMYSAVTGFFAIGPTIAKMMGEDLDFDAHGSAHIKLMQRYANASLPGGDP